MARERGIQEEALKQASLPTTAKIRIGFFQFMGPAGRCPEGDRGRADVAALLDQLMYEIKVVDLATDSPDFGVVRRTVLDRYDRLYKQHAPDGRLTYRRAASQREIVAGTYTAIVLTHARVAAGAFDSELYASGFALMRPMLEALLKQYTVGGYGRDDDGWKNDINDQPRITKVSLRKLADLGGPDYTHLWAGFKPWLNDFVHGGYGQLSSNHNPEIGKPDYPASWFWTAMLIATLSMLYSSAWLWAYLGHEDRATAIRDGMNAESWNSLAVMHNGQEVRIAAERAPIVPTQS